MQIYKVEDLSNGREARKIPAYNKYNYDKIPEFEYITGIEVSQEIASRFKAKEGCKCQPNGCESNDCGCDGKTQFCSASCQCNASTCPKRFQPIPNDFQVYYVNPQKQWGLRTLDDIEKGTILFEYGGILTEDKEGIDEDDYIYYFESEETKAKYMINAHKKGNLARFINHSCSPNCDTHIAAIDAQDVPHLLIFAKQKIHKGEELTLDYGDAWWASKMEQDGIKCVCVCKSMNCEYSDIKKNIESATETNSMVSGENAENKKPAENEPEELLQSPSTFSASAINRILNGTHRKGKRETAKKTRATAKKTTNGTRCCGPKKIIDETHCNGQGHIKSPDEAVSQSAEGNNNDDDDIQVIE